LERFVEQILQANQVDLPVDIYGLDRKMGKQAVLQELLERHGDKKLQLLNFCSFSATPSNKGFMVTHSSRAC
jgi:hypothetical protein